MKNHISPDDCQTMFSDKLDSLSMKELGIELKHFSIGTAPECPSYLVNQDELKNTLIEKFSNFFNPNESQGLELIFLKSNYGNGKSHFIRTIHSFLSNYSNVLTKRVSLKQEEADLKKKILEGVGQKTIKDSAVFLVDSIVEKASNDIKETILLTLTETYNISFALAELLYQAARSDDMSKQAKAIAILKGNYLTEYLKTFSLTKSNLNNEFYFNIIKLICEYLAKNNYYLVITFDEYEHIYSWKNKQARKTLFEDIKFFTDYIETYRNLFFVFAESESVDSDEESIDDPAYVSRKKSRIYYIKNISSQNEVEELFKMIKSRYEKYYQISFDAYQKEMLIAINNDSQVKSNSNYRNYTQAIIRVLNHYKDASPQSEENEKSIENNNSENKSNNSNIFSEKWKASTSITKKTMLCEALEHILKQSSEQILSKSKKQGVYKTQNQQDIIEYHIVTTDNPSNSEFIRRYINILKTQTGSGISKNIILYPYKNGIDNEFIDENVILYNIDEVPTALQQIYANTNNIDNVFNYLKALETRC